jgi:hypothetical protein
MNNIKTIKILLGALVLITGRLQAADKPRTDSLTASVELVKLRMVLTDTAHMSFDALFYFENVDSITVRDTMHMAYQINKNQYHIVVNDSLEVVQNIFYNLVLYHDRDMAILSKPVNLVKYLFHANLLDGNFNRLFISGLKVSETGSFRKLSYQFKPGCPYEKYEIFYDPATYRINKIQYQMRKDPFSSTPATANDRYLVNIQFSNYQTGLFNDSVFSTDTYFVRRQGLFQMTTPYSGYELINSLNQ